MGEFIFWKNPNFSQFLGFNKKKQNKICPGKIFLKTRCKSETLIWHVYATGILLFSEMDFILGSQNWGRTELLYYFLQQTRIVEIALVLQASVVCIEINWISDLMIHPGCKSSSQNPLQCVASRYWSSRWRRHAILMIQVFSSHFGCIFAYFISFCFCVKMELQLQTKFSLNWIIEMQHFGNRIANVHHAHIISMGSSYSPLTWQWRWRRFKTFLSFHMIINFLGNRCHY